VRRKKKKKWEETDLIPIVQIPEVKRKKVTEDDVQPMETAASEEDGIQDLEAHFAAKYGRRKASSYKKHMTNIDLARREVSKLARVPNSKDDLEKWMRHRINAPSKKYSYTKRKELAAAMQLRWNAFKRNKNLEATLHLWDSVTALRYKPDPKEQINSGSFSVLVKGMKDEVEVTADWVHANFEKDVVKAVMDSAIDSFIPVKSSVNIPLDTRQIQKLRYVVSEDDEFTGSFQGITSDKQVVELTEEFVKLNFPDEFVSYAIEKGKLQANNQFVHIPPGAPRTSLGHWMLDESHPEVEYLQCGDDTCLFSSLASALHYLHIRETAKHLAELAPVYSAKKEGGVTNWNALLETMKQNCGWLVPTKINGKSFDILHDISEYPTVVSLEAVDGGTQHAVTIVGKLVFDSNCERALPLSQKTLDYCCSTDEKEGAYKRVFKGYRFIEPMEKKRKMLDQLKKEFDIDFFIEKNT